MKKRRRKQVRFLFLHSNRSSRILWYAYCLLGRRARSRPDSAADAADGKALFSAPGSTEISLRNPTCAEAALLESVAKAENLKTIWQLHNGEGITGRDLALLVNGDWLNSEIINSFFSLLKIRCDKFERSRSLLRVHCFSSFFYTKYQAAGYEGVRRWTKNTDLFKHDLVLVPINHENSHWSLVAVNFQNKRIEYYDSLLCHWKAELYTKIMKSILEYICAERMSRGGTCDQDRSTQLKIMADIPQQIDGSSCGIFVCAYADYLTRGCSPPFPFSHEDISRYQASMAADMLSGYLR